MTVKLSVRRRKVVQKYRRRLMAKVDMPDDQWEQYRAWIYAFGKELPNETTRYGCPLMPRYKERLRR